MLAISSANNAQLEVIEPKEKDLQNFILANWANIFANLVLIKAEFELEGNVRSKTDKSGRIDILAFNPITNRLVVIELKRNAHANILHQASDYKDFIEDNFSAIYLQITQKHQITLPTSLQMDKNSVELILIAKIFAETDIQKAKKETNQNLITLVKYQAFNFLATPLYVFDFLNNETVYFKKVTKNGNFTEEFEQIVNVKQFLETYKHTNSQTP